MHSRARLDRVFDQRSVLQRTRQDLQYSSLKKPERLSVAGSFVGSRDGTCVKYGCHLKRSRLLRTRQAHRYIHHAKCGPKTRYIIFAPPGTRDTTLLSLGMTLFFTWSVRVVALINYQAWRFLKPSHEIPSCLI